uniref:Protein FMC1 homolog n=1 Tax=Parastrongyloides trichosuri TaxID=131310 RepID=A0A0N5A300_PARTI
MTSRVLSNFKTMFKEISQIPEKTFLDKKVYMNALSQYRMNSKTVILKNPNVEESVTSTYATYLAASKRLSCLQDEYRGGERSVEESANLVGLTLPKKHEGEI